MARAGKVGASGVQPVRVSLSPERAAEVAALRAERERQEAAQRRRDLAAWLLPRLGLRVLAVAVVALVSPWPWLAVPVAVLAWKMTW